MEFEDMELEESATSSGMKQFGRILAIGIILIVAAFGDVMYLQLMNSHFPGGLLMALCYVGAFTSFLAVAYMLIGKSILFTPGMQMIVAWFVFIMELALIALNIILVFQSDGASSTGFLAAWLQLAPATPVINMAGVAILYFLDEEGKMRNEDVELAWDMKRAKRRFFKATAKARLRLQNKQLNFLVTEMDRAVASPESMQAIQQTAIEMNQYLLGQLSGGRTYRIPALPAGTTVDSNPPTPPSEPTPPTAPEPEKKRGWLRNPFAREEQPSPISPPIQNQERQFPASTAAQRHLRERAPIPAVSVAASRRVRRAARFRGAVTSGNYQATETAKQERKQAAGPTTEKLAPFLAAPTPRGNGAKMNGNHPKPMPQ
jgi:hypothetical protein